MAAVALATAGVGLLLVGDRPAYAYGITITTQVHNAAHQEITSIPVGQAVHDKALISYSVPGQPAQGTVTFVLYSGLACSGTPLSTQANVPLGPEVATQTFGPESTPVTLAAGSYSYQATFVSTGTPPYPTSPAACEPFTVTGTPPPPPPTGTQGCTPGFYKNSPQRYPAGYSASGSFEAALGADVPGISATFTIDDALNLGGGGLNALIRHAAAAILNSAQGSSVVNYPYTVAQVKSMFAAALASGTYEATKDRFAAANELGCPLSASLR